MSANVDLGTDVIQHIDDACEEEYNEGFAPKAQEEILSETQDSYQACDSLKNTTDEATEQSKSVDISNDEINEASNELVKEVITDVESDLNIEDDQGIHLNDESVKITDISPDSELNGELIDADEADVVMAEPDADVDIKDTEDQEVSNDLDEHTLEESAVLSNENTAEDEVNQVENIVDEVENPIDDEVEHAVEDEVEHAVGDEVENVVGDEVENTIEDEVETVVHDEPEIEVEESHELESTNVEDEIVEANNEIIDEQLVQNDEITEEVKPDTEIQNETVETKSEIKENASEDTVKINNVPTKGKDVKSLSSTYGHEENLANGDCCMCNKIVYPMEKLVTNDRLFHKTCFRCTKCKNALSTGNFTFNHGKPYCTPHYVELFKKRGRYDEVDDKIETENSPTTDINDVLTDELPAPDTTKNILAKFRDLQSSGVNNANQSSINESSDELPAPNTTKNLMERFTALGQEKSESKCKPKIDIPRHTNGHANGSSENVPVVLSSDVVRSNDPAQDDLPEQGITKNLVNQFRKMESLANN